MISSDFNYDWLTGISDIVRHISPYPVISGHFETFLVSNDHSVVPDELSDFLGIFNFRLNFAIFSHFGTINSVYQFEKFSYLGWIPRFFIFRKICVIDHLSWFWSFPDISISESVTGWLKGVYLTGYMMYIIGAGPLKSYKMQLGREKEIF